MEATFFVMAIMGCGDANTACTEARVDPVRYSNVAQCQAAMPAALARNNDLSFPVISATCRSGAPQWVRTAAKALPRG
ncbi:hypothetical protein [Sphingomonas sp.]|uniref:hypothetical protein n=1 Tax=Sphingomonas sp. TaxID=28214 RepID=UPI0035C87DFC